MTRSQLTELIREVLQELDEANVSGAVGAYHTPFAFGKGTRAKQALKRQGYKQVSRPKRPSHTKGFDYL
jgi:hypothetical protein